MTLGFSPCPNDTFIFDALVHRKIDTNGLNFSVQMEDVEQLNQWAKQGKLDITKLSFFAYTQLSHKYQLLDSGAALGRNCGPMLISKQKYTLSDVKNLTIAIPGEQTTANFLLTFAFGNKLNKKVMLFSEIEQAILSGEVDAGLIIHESRFTFEEKGLSKIIDLGEHWETQTGHPIPLGGIAILRSLPQETKLQINQLLRQSVEFAFQNPSESKSFVSAHAQEMSEEVMQKHINLYVNDFSINLGIEGRAAVDKMVEIGKNIGVVQNLNEKIWLE
jgi:1,4-dihydroxy-6-naphthoate synthase